MRLVFVTSWHHEAVGTELQRTLLESDGCFLDVVQETDTRHLMMVWVWWVGRLQRHDAIATTTTRSSSWSFVGSCWYSVLWAFHRKHFNDDVKPIYLFKYPSRKQTRSVIISVILDYKENDTTVHMRILTNKIGQNHEKDL